MGFRYSVFYLRVMLVQQHCEVIRGQNSTRSPCVCVVVTHARAENGVSNEITSGNETNLYRPYSRGLSPRIVGTQESSLFLTQTEMIRPPPPYTNIRSFQTAHELFDLHSLNSNCLFKYYRIINSKFASESMRNPSTLRICSIY
jgi:hypothetical protein